MWWHTQRNWGSESGQRCAVIFNGCSAGRSTISELGGYSGTQAQGRGWAGCPATEHGRPAAPRCAHHLHPAPRTLTSLRWHHWQMPHRMMVTLRLMVMMAETRTTSREGAPGEEQSRAEAGGPKGGWTALLGTHSHSTAPVAWAQMGRGSVGTHGRATTLPHCTAGAGGTTSLASTAWPLPDCSCCFQRLYVHERGR